MHSLTPYPITPIGNFIGVVLALLPLLSNIRKLSLAVWGYAIWIAIYDFQFFVNSIIWRNNVNIVAPVWCDIVTKLQSGSVIGTRACTIVLCVRLYNLTRLHGSVENVKKQKRNTIIFELSLIIGLPVIVMALWIVVQPLRFNISEEVGCLPTVYSYVGYILKYAPNLVGNVTCLILAPLTLRTFSRRRKEMGEFLSSGRDWTHNKYRRLMIIACLDTAFNLPVLILDFVTEILEGQDDTLNEPYISWKNVHDGDGGLLPGSSLSSVAQTPASEWSTDGWGVFVVKWDEWLFVLHALVFFCVFGTTPEMRSYYRAAFWFIPKRLGYKRNDKPASETETISDIMFNSNSGRPAINKRRGSLSFLESTIESASAARSAIASNLSARGTRFDNATNSIEERTENQEGR